MSWDGRIRADARHIPLTDKCVQMVCTSPPYWGLRDYGQSGQIGLEATPEAYVASIVTVFREVWRVLKADGVCWLNLGDTYSGNRGYQVPDSKHCDVGNARGMTVSRRRDNVIVPRSDKLVGGLQAKQLIGIPWKVAFALQADGWWLRSDIIWAKPNPMPESVTDRPTRAHEYIFLLSKSERYFYDYESIKESVGETTRRAATFRNGGIYTGGCSFDNHGHKEKDSHGDGLESLAGRNKRSVWQIATQPYPEAHYATFPEEIPETCIRAGSKPGDLILDPFFGSGTVGRAAERLSRRWVGLDLGYQDLQAKRVRNVQKELVLL